MRRQYLFLAFFVLLLGTLLACGYLVNRRAAAPMAQRQDRVSISMSALPETLFEAELLASGGNPIVCLDSTLYEVQSNAYRRLELPVEQAGVPDLITAAPDGGFWMVLEYSQEECYLVKTSSQGTVLAQQILEPSNVNSIICDSVGRVYLLVDHCTVRRYSPEGLLQNTVELDNSADAAALVAQNDRVFAACLNGRGKKRVEYIEICEDLSLGDCFSGCVKMESSGAVNAMGSFLPEYILMEYDAVGLYACQEDGAWEMVCRWSDRHLDGAVEGRLIRDTQGRGVVLYTQSGTTYALALSSAKK